MAVKRLEFKAAAVRAIMARAGYPDDPRCEWPGCGASLRKGGALDHKIPEWLQGGQHEGRAELTGDDGWMLCPEHHKPKTSREHKDRAKGDRIVLKAAGIKRKGRAMFGTRASGVRKRMSGRVESW